MRFTTPTALLALASLSTHLLAAPIPASAGDGPAAVTAPLVDTLLGSDNVNSIDAIADVLGVAQYGSADNAEDQDALPQQTLDNTIGSSGAVTEAAEALPVKARARRGAVGTALAKELVDINGDFDQTMAASDEIANNLLGVCGEDTTAPEAECGAVTTGKTGKK